jgi:hypothetical protein
VHEAEVSCAARHNANVLFCGECGVGKDVRAQNTQERDKCTGRYLALRKGLKNPKSGSRKRTHYVTQPDLWNFGNVGRDSRYVVGSR